ncbi:MAG: tyrosine-protein phosphatase [Lachnospiraceae bacterium]|nr:tyrosine-protein phosphatase [Lachnospiraceae bacterium]
MSITPRNILEQMKSSQALKTTTLNNARELGGYVMKDGRTVRRGKLLRTVLLKDASQEDLAVLQDEYDLRLILDMREADEIKRDPDPALSGVTWVQTPIIDYSGMADLAAKLQGHQEFLHPTSTEDQIRGIAFFITEFGADLAYAHYLESSYGQEGLKRFFKELLACPEGAVLWHCYTGKDRTGIAAGLILEILGADWETILADYELSGLYFEDRIQWAYHLALDLGYDKALAEKIAALMTGVHADFLTRAWNYMYESWGSPLGYLKGAIGLSEEDISTLKERYLE